MTTISKPKLLVAAALAGGIALARSAARRRRAFELYGRVVLVTGGSRGLGFVLAGQLGRAGARVAICARDEVELARARVLLERAGAPIFAVPCDVTDRAQVDAMLAQVRQRLGPVEALINNAGVIQVGPMDEMTAADYDEALRIHFWGPLHTMLGVLPEMRRRGEGRIVNIASVGGKISVPHLLPYSASKFALVGLSSGMRAALAKDGVYVTTVCPGLMRTGSPRNASFKGRHQQEFAWFSISDSTPVLSMPASRAARRIIDALRHGDAELVMPFSTAAAVKLSALLPGLGAAVMGLAERVLPGPGGIGSETRLGEDSESGWAPSVLTALSDRAAERHNEVGT